jgi:hypothetical protein
LANLRKFSTNASTKSSRASRKTFSSQRSQKSAVKSFKFLHVRSQMEKQKSDGKAEVRWKKQKSDEQKAER